MGKKRKTYQLIIFFSLSFCGSAGLYAQQSAVYSYQYYNTSHGLPSSEIICLAKDNKGFLWLGTSAGLSMYDGYSFQNYASSKENDLIGYVNVIKAGVANRLWIGTGAGLFCYVNNEIIKISAATSLPQGVNDILPEKDGSLWLATENGPVYLDAKKTDLGGLQKIVLAGYVINQWPFKNANIEKRRAVLISKAGDGTLYIAQHYSLFRLTADSLVLLHQATNTSDKILTLFPVSKSKVYFDAAATEINQIEHGVHSTIPLKKFYQPSASASLPGQWYVGTRGSFYFHPQTGMASRYISFSDKYIVWTSAILPDNHFLWVASHDGLIKLKPSIFNSYTIDKTSAYNDYYAVTELSNGKLLLGANIGKVYEKRADTFRLFSEKIVPRAEIKSFFEDAQNQLWIATGYQGLVRMSNTKTETFTVADGLHDNSLTWFLKTNNNKLYVFGDQGMSEIITGSNGAVHFKKYYYPPNVSKNARFFSGIEAPDGSIWMGGEEGIAYLRNDSLQKFTFNTTQLPVNFLLKDREDNIWIAVSGGGILQCIFNKKNELEIVRRFTETDGLNTMHYLTLLEDKENNIWAGSSRGISVIGRTEQYKDRILNFDESDGFIKAGYSNIRLYQATDSTIWAATVFGITSFRPQHLIQQAAAPLIYITGIRQIAKNQVIARDLIKKPASQNTFSYANNSFNFSFSALDYANQENIRYYYKLEGLDSNWVNNVDQRSVSFENLSPGHYTLHVKAMNSKSTWSTQDAVYVFAITPPYWKTWWFVSALLFSIATLAFFIGRRRIQLVKNRESAKTALQQLKASNYREQLEIEQIINYFATSMNSVNSVDDILWDVAKNCISKLQFEDCVIYLKDEKLNAFIQKSAWGPKMAKENTIFKPITLSPGVGIVGSVAISGIAEIINDTSADPRYIVDDEKRMSEITVPIMANGTVIGVLDSEHSQKGFYTQRHLQILITIASLCAGKIETIKAELQTREKEMEVLRLNRDFATSQLTALRTQMNPHFIFNALNSVQHYILQGNVIDANKYLSKFSKLQREILHCSNKQFISLEKEIEILSQYLDLEQNRFGDSFTWHINMDSEIEPVEIKIPPMVLQPFVENAIWHGLMPQQKERTLSIFFDLESDDILLATLRDNGIGREASAKLKQQHGGDKVNHESKGMSMVHQRLQLLQQQYDKPFAAAISDITDTNGNIQGTQVTLKIFIGNTKL